MIGIFVVFSFALFMVAVTLFGGAHFFKKERLVIAYFEDSLKGLSVGAPVTYRGVTIGQVKEIKIQIYNGNTKQQKVIIPIIIALNPKQSLVTNGPNFDNGQDVDDFVEAMCQEGLRAKLKMISIVTGKLYVDLAIYKDTIAVYQDRGGKYLEIPTLPSDMHQILKVMEDMDLTKFYSTVVKTLGSLEQITKSLAQTMKHENTQKLVKDVSTAATNLNTVLARIDDNIAPIFEKVDSGLENINTLTSHADDFLTSLNTEIKPVSTGMTRTLQNLDNTLLEADQFLQEAEHLLRPASPLYHRLSETLDQLKETSGSIKKLSDSISRNPESLLFGKQQTGENHDPQ